MADELDALYAADLDAFTAERNDTAKRLRAVGDTAAADAVQALRKPALPAWAINRAVRDDRKAADALLDAGHALRQAQRKLLQGGSQKAFAEARARHGRAVDALLARAQAALAQARGAAPEATLDRIRATLQAASVSDEGRPLLARGRLVADVAPSGFEGLGDVPLAADASSQERRKRVQALERDLRAARDAAHEARERAAATRAEARTARTRADELERGADRADTASERADHAVRDLEEQLRAEKRG
jgi:hypothetical protein